MVKKDFNNQLKKAFGIDLKDKNEVYQKPYPTFFYSVPYPLGWRVPDFVKFNGEESKTTWEHMGAQL